MKPRHVYRPPRRNRFLSTAIIFGGGAMLTFMVFYFIPLMQKLEQGMAEPQEDLAPPIVVAPTEDYIAPEPEVEEEKEEVVEEMAESNDDIPIDPPEIAPLTGGTGRVLLNVKPSVALGGGESMDASGVDAEPVIVSKAAPNVSPAIRKILSKRGAVKVFISGLIDERGKVTDTSVAQSSGIPALDQAAAKAFARFKFKPAIRNGRQAKAKVRQEFTFKIGG